MQHMLGEEISWMQVTMHNQILNISIPAWTTGLCRNGNDPYCGKKDPTRGLVPGKGPAYERYRAKIPLLNINGQSGWNGECGGFVAQYDDCHPFVRQNCRTFVKTQKFQRFFHGKNHFTRKVYNQLW
jgi:hypothetical protein